MRRIVPWCLVLLLAACSSWTKPGGTPDMLTADQNDCSTAALRDFPPVVGPALGGSPGMTSPGYACAPDRGCVPTSGAAPAATITDQNQAARNAAIDKCMIGKGWSR